MVDGFVYLAVPALVAVQILPHAVSERDVTLVFLAAAGALVPTAFERFSRSLAHHTDDLAILVGVSGLVVHATLEGAALAPPSGRVEPLLGWAVILHRVPVGLVIWWLIRPRHGIPLASLGVGSLVLATLAGAALGHELTGPGHGEGFDHYAAFVAGTLLHVVFHQGRHDHRHDHAHEHEQEVRDRPDTARGDDDPRVHHHSHDVHGLDHTERDPP